MTLIHEQNIIDVMDAIKSSVLVCDDCDRKECCEEKDLWCEEAIEKALRQQMQRNNQEITDKLNETKVN